MVKLFGATLTAAACAWIGFRGAGTLRLRVRGMRELEQGLLLLERELELHKAPLPELLEQVSRRSTGCAARLFSLCWEGMQGLERSSVRDIWERSLASCSVLGEETFQILLPLGAVLGQCGAEAQVEGIAAVRGQLERLSRLAEEEWRQQGGVYRIIGVSGGAFLVILLL